MTCNVCLSTDDENALDFWRDDIAAYIRQVGGDSVCMCCCESLAKEFADERQKEVDMENNLDRRHIAAERSNRWAFYG